MKTRTFLVAMALFCVFMTLMSVVYWNAHTTPVCVKEIELASWDGVAIGVFTGVILTLIGVLFIIYTPIKSGNNNSNGSRKRVVTFSFGTGRVISIEEFKKLPPGPV